MAEKFVVVKLGAHIRYHTVLGDDHLLGELVELIDLGKVTLLAQLNQVLIISVGYLAGKVWELLVVWFNKNAYWPEQRLPVTWSFWDQTCCTHWAWPSYRGSPLTSQSCQAVRYWVSITDKINDNDLAIALMNLVGDHGFTGRELSISILLTS